MLPIDMTFSHLLAMGLVFVCWIGYNFVLTWFGRGTLNSQLVSVREQWFLAATWRAAKPFDAVLLGQIINAIAFFGSATLLVLAGVLSSFVNLKHVHETFSDMHFMAPYSLALFAIFIGFLAVVIAICFFSFTYALRKIIYTIALLGALPEGPDGTMPECPHTKAMAKATSMVLSEAIKTFNFGIRGYYYAIASLGMFVSPYVCMIATVGVTVILIARQLMTPTARAIQRYVDAMQELNQ